MVRLPLVAELRFKVVSNTISNFREESKLSSRSSHPRKKRKPQLHIRSYLPEL